MAGLSDFSAQAALNWEAGVSPMPAIGSRYLALFTTAPTADAGTGGTEASGTAYARVQVAGALTASASFTTASTTITMASAVPAWVVNGMNIYDLTNSQQIGTVQSISSSTVTLTGTAAHASSGSSDSLQFSAWPAASASSGTEPATAPANLTNANAVITFAQAGGSGWGTVTSWGIYDALTSGNLITWDFLGNNKWSPFTCTSATPGVLTCTDQSFSNGESVVVSTKFGGALPTTGGSWAGVLTVAGLSGATFNVGVNTTGTGDGLVRGLTQQPIAVNVTATFSTSTFTLTLA